MTREPAGAFRDARAVQVAAQAKVNLRLKILAREAGGYHQLETLFLRLELADLVRVRRARTRSLDIVGDVDVAALGPADANLAWRAAIAWADAAASAEPFAIELEKRIPIGAGLGGGSADAGAVLRALDAMADRPLGARGLRRIAASIGADVPFLVGEHPYALAWGRGERMLTLVPPPARSIALLVPAFGVRTAEAYGWLDATRHPGDAAGDETLLDVDMLQSWEEIAAIAVNDFEPVVAARHPLVATLVDGLRAIHCLPAMLSGSGSTVFGVLPAGTAVALPAIHEPCTALVTRSATRVEPLSALD